MDSRKRFDELAKQAADMGGAEWSAPEECVGDHGNRYYEITGPDRDVVIGENCYIDEGLATYFSNASPSVIVAAQKMLQEKDARIAELEQQLVPTIRRTALDTLASDLQEYLYRCGSQVPFEHAAWANERGAALLDQVKQLVAENSYKPRG